MNASDVRVNDLGAVGFEAEISLLISGTQDTCHSHDDLTCPVFVALGVFLRLSERSM